MCLQAEERAEKEAQRQMEKDAKNMFVHCLPCCAVLSAAAVMCLQAEERAEKEAQRQMEKDARNREREEAKKMARYPIEDTEVRPSLSFHHSGSPAGTITLTPVATHAL